MSTTSETRLASRTAAELVELYSHGAVTPVEVLSDVLELADEAREAYSAIAFLNTEAAQLAATESAARWASGVPRGPLDGIPVSIKDSIPAIGTPWQHGSAVHEPIYTTADSAPVKRLREAGALIFAKATMPDLGMVASGISSLYGIVRNPWNPTMSPGGSSSGAGVLVAAGVGPISIGTDLGGSVRCPAAHNGLFGFKPTQGLIAYAPASAVRSPGPLARTVDDLETALEVIGVEDDSDVSSLPGRYRPGAPITDLRGVRVGLVRHMGAGMPTGDEEYEAAERQARILAEAGAEVVEIPDLGLRPEDQDAMVTTFRFRVLAELHSVPMARRGLLLPELVDFAEKAYELSGLAYAEAMNRLEAAKGRARAAAYEWDYLLTPAMSVASFPAELLGPAGSTTTIDHCQFTAWFNQTGQPAGVVPSGLTSQGMPVGAQLVGRRFADAAVVALMRFLSERAEMALDYPFLGRSSQR